MSFIIRNGDSCKKKKCPFLHKSKLTVQLPPVVEAPSAPKGNISRPAAAIVEEETYQQPLRLEDLNCLHPSHVFNKAMFPFNLLKRFEKKTSADRELTMQWTAAWLKVRRERRGYPCDPENPERNISIDYAFNKLSNDQLNTWMIGHGFY